MDKPVTPDSGGPCKWYGERAAYRQPNGKLRWYRFYPNIKDRWVRCAGPEEYADQEDTAEPLEPFRPAPPISCRTKGSP